MSFDLTQPVVLQEPNEMGLTPSGAREYQTYTEYNTRAALLSAKGGTDLYDTMEVAESVRVFVVRYRPDLNANWRLIWNNQIHPIDSVEPVANLVRRNGWLRLVCDTANTENLVAQTARTGPQPVFAFTDPNNGGAGTTRTNYDVSALMGQVVDQPAGDGTTAVSFAPTDPTPTGKYVVFLYPQAWGNPSGVYATGNRSINQVDLFRFVPANLLGSTSQFSHRYRAMISNYRVATDAQITYSLEW